jgi:hypothetical protein
MSYVSRWAKPSSDNDSNPFQKNSKPVFLNRAADGLVNTSLPAQNAPKLIPTTLAAATLKPMEASEKRRAPTANVESVDEFPSLGKSKPKVAETRPTMNFAALSRDWAQKQKEDEAKDKEEKEKQRVEDQLKYKEQMRRAKDEEVLRKSGIFGIRVGRKKSDSDDEKYSDAYKSENSDEPYLSDGPDTEEAYEDEEEEYECDGGWNQRKHRDEMY